MRVGGGWRAGGLDFSSFQGGESNMGRLDNIDCEEGGVNFKKLNSIYTYSFIVSI